MAIFIKIVMSSLLFNQALVLLIAICSGFVVFLASSFIIGVSELKDFRAWIIKKR